MAFTNASLDGWGIYGRDGYTSVDFKGLSIPLEVNAIMGRWKSKFELGIGIIPAVLEKKEWGYTHPFWDTDDDYSKRTTRLNATAFMNVGYRYQRQSGFFCASVSLC